MHLTMRGSALAALLWLAAPAALPVTLFLVPAKAETVDPISVTGKRRVAADTIRSYFKPGPNGALDAGRVDDGLKALIETGLFQDVKINRDRGRLVVVVVENPVINRIAFEGNKKLKDGQLWP